MKWTILPTIAVEAWFDRKLADAADKLNAKIAGILERRAAIKKGIAGVTATDPSEIDLLNTVEFPSFRVTGLQLLQVELRTRRELVQFWQDYHAALPAAAKAASKDLAKVEAEIVRGLEQLGFPTTIETGRAPWLPGVIQSHPRLAAARQTVLAFDGRMNDHSRERANAEATDQVTAEIQRAVAPGLHV